MEGILHHVDIVPVVLQEALRRKYKRYIHRVASRYFRKDRIAKLTARIWHNQALVWNPNMTSLFTYRIWMPSVCVGDLQDVRELKETQEYRDGSIVLPFHTSLFSASTEIP